MRKNKFIKKLMLIVTMVSIVNLTFTSETVVTKASEADVKDALETYYEENGVVPSSFISAASFATKKKNGKIDENDYTSVEIDLIADGEKVGTSKYYYKIDDEADLLESIQDSGSGKAQIKELETNDLISDMGADVDGATGLMVGILKPIKTLLGILVVFLTVGMTVFTSIDLCYIAFPVFRNFMDDAKANGTKGVTKTDRSNGEVKLTLVTEDAQFAVASADMVNSGKSPFLIYFKKRGISIVVLSVMIFILLTGNMSVLTDLGIKLAEGVLNALTTL